ncbi:MAG: hypothetical protein ACJA0Q_000289 [Saprospiraceae bacterium]|jgi:uncharacterized protein YbbC (DUF1343 family)
MNWKSVSFSLINLSVGFYLLMSCSSVVQKAEITSELENLNDADSNDSKAVDYISSPTITGADQTTLYFPQLTNKIIGVVANNTSFIKKTHLVDSLLSIGIKVKIVFSPEHGFRGDQDAGVKVKHSVDLKTELPIYSLHGQTKKPSAKSLEGVDVMLFDIQDVGVRFYTYISTLHYVMEACAENNVKLIVLDRPNPNAHYVAGPVLDEKFKSFVGMHPVPVVYGMSIGEYAKMINGEYWLKDSLVCDLKVVRLGNWTYDKEYILPIPPSPNLSSQLSIYLYPHLCLFEGTSISVGRGTPEPFEKYGHPLYRSHAYSFTPVSVVGKSSHPPFKNKKCFGKNLSSISLKQARAIKEFKLTYLMDARLNTTTDNFFAHTSFFNLLAGNDVLVNQLKEGLTEVEIQQTWEQGLLNFNETRQKYLLYTETK